SGPFRDAVPEQLAGLDAVEEDGEGAELEADGGDAGEVIADARDLAAQGAQVLRALGTLDPDELLDAHDVADVVEDRRHVVEPVGVGQHLVPGGGLAALRETAVEEADLRYRVDD